MYKRNQDILSEILDGEGAILLNRETGMTFILNHVGYYIWENIEGNTVDSLASGMYSSIANQNEYSLEEIHKYVSEYINTLVNKGLVVC